MWPDEAGDPGTDPLAVRNASHRPLAAGADHDLGGVLGPREVEQGDGDVVADDRVEGAAQRLGEAALAADALPGRPAGQTVGA